jgi:PilZ domain-containing protein
MPNERRKTLRQNLGIPVRVQGFLADGGTWEELTTTLDVSYGGACFVLGHEAELGQVLLLSLALPKRLRQFDLTASTYRVYTLVRGVRRREERPRVGVMFFGKYPPREFQERPAARFLLPTDSVANAPVPRGLRGDTPLGGTPAVGAAPHHEEARDEVPSPDTLVGAPPANWPGTATRTGSSPRLTGLPGPDASGRYNTPPPMTAPSTIPKGRAGVPPAPVPGASRPEFQPSREVPEDRRRSPRVQLFVNFTIQLVDEWGAVLQEELTVADNVSRGGARVMTSLGFQAGEILLLQEAGGGFATRAEVRAITKVQPTVDRLHLRFLDRQAPERLLRS